jgi:cellobiose phosphorylase
MEFGHFDDSTRSYVISNPLPPRPWTNYLGNGRLQAFISQNAGGLLWYIDPESRRITRYQYTGSPQDRPGFYTYIRDNRTGDIWNPHFAPTCRSLDTFQCRHAPGITSFVGARNGLRVAVDYFIPVDDDVFVWNVRVTNDSPTEADFLLANYIEFGILEPPRELYWCYIQRAAHTTFDAQSQCIRYSYLPFEAAFCPKMVVACSEKLSGFECSREAFMGPGGSLENPKSLLPGAKLGNHELPLGGHGCGVMGVEVKLAPGQSKALTYTFAIADDWPQAQAAARKYDPAVAQLAITHLNAFWNERFQTLQVQTGDAHVDRFVNTWNPYQAVQLAALPAKISAEHQGVAGMEYRDFTQFALAPANLDPPLAADRLQRVLSSQKADGTGPFNFWPWLKSKAPAFGHRRSDNTVWQIYTLYNMVCETGDLTFLDRQLPYFDGGQASVYEHTLQGLRHIVENLGPTGLPLMFEADWNDQLIHFSSPVTESVMLGMQLEYSCKLMADLATRLGKPGDAQWCLQAAAAQDQALNSDRVWDGRWYRRLIMGDKCIGSTSDAEGKIWLNPQSWSVICGCGDFQGRGRIAMDEMHKHLDSPAGLVKQDPPFGLIHPRPGVQPGVGENGGIFCHANTWAIMADVLLGRPQAAFALYRQLLPGVLAEKFGQQHYEGEPYVYASSLVGPVSPLFGQAGITWTTGAASWMYIAATQYILGIRPTLDGLFVQPCLPPAIKSLRVQRRFRSCMYDIEIDNAGGPDGAPRPSPRLTLNGTAIAGNTLPIQQTPSCTVHCTC